MATKANIDHIPIWSSDTEQCLQRGFRYLDGYLTKIVNQCIPYLDHQLARALGTSIANGIPLRSEYICSPRPYLLKKAWQCRITAGTDLLGQSHAVANRVL